MVSRGSGFCYASNAMAIVCGSPPMMDVIKIYTILSSSVGSSLPEEEHHNLSGRTFLGSKWRSSSMEFTFKFTRYV